MPGVCSPSSPGIGIAIGGSPAVEEGEPNPNLLLWSEALDNAVWTATDCTVTPDLANDSSGQATLDRLVFAELGSIGQTSTTAASTGATVTALCELTVQAVAYTVTGTFDAQPYTAAIELRVAAVGPSVQIAISRSGGFLRVVIRDFASEAPTVFAGRAKLEVGASFTGYVKREGA